MILVSSITSSPAVDLSRMRSAQAMIDSARTQADLNNASLLLSNAWDDELRKKEHQMEASMPMKNRKAFREAMKMWRGYVERMCTLRSELFKNDMTQPSFYRLRGMESKDAALKNAKEMQPYVYNMSKSIYYEDKWSELDALINME